MMIFFVNMQNMLYVSGVMKFEIDRSDGTRRLKLSWPSFVPVNGYSVFM